DAVMTGSGGAQREQPHFIGDILRKNAPFSQCFVPSLQRRNRRNYKLLDKNTFLHKFDGVPFALRAYLCYNN
uniref:hypothetical protein n=1 Tax=Gemmiger formicilis TaxID=745368 RepID=UPI00402A3F86